MAKNYEKIIKDATTRIANYYSVKLMKQAGKYSVEKCGRMLADMYDMSRGADLRKTPEYYSDYKWMALGMQMPYLDKDVWDTVVKPFFTAARDYVVRMQGEYGVSSREEQAVDIAVKELYEKIGDTLQTLEVYAKQKPIDYAQSVSDTVEKIAEFYDAKVEKIKDEISEREQEAYLSAIKHLREGADVENIEYYTNFGWTKGQKLYDLDQSFWQDVEKFFNCAKAYAEAKHKGLSLDEKSEKELNKFVKLINLKIGNRMFEGLKNLFLPDTYYMARRKLGDCVTQKVK